MRGVLRVMVEKRWGESDLESGGGGMGDVGG